MSTEPGAAQNCEAKQSVGNEDSEANHRDEQEQQEPDELLPLELHGTEDSDRGITLRWGNLSVDSDASASRPSTNRLIKALPMATNPQ